MRNYCCKNCIAVAVYAEFYNFKKMSACFTLCPESISSSAKECKFLCVKSFFKGFFVCVAHHQNLASPCVLSDYRNHSVNFFPVKAAHEAVFKANLVCIERHSKLNVAAHAFKFFNFTFCRNTAGNYNAALYSLAKFLCHFHVCTLHAAFFFNAGEQKFRTVFFCHFCAFNHWHINSFSPAFYSDFSVQCINTNDDSLLSDCCYKFFKEFYVQNV